MALVVVAAGCGRSKRLNKNVTLWRTDKIPYGTYYAYENLRHVFPDASVVINKKSPDQYKTYSYKTEKEEEDSDTVQYADDKTNYIIISNQVLPDESEVNALLNLVGKGQHVFISAFTISESLLDSLHLKTAFYSSLFNTDDSLTVSVNNPETNDSLSFTYPGTALDNYFASVDSNITSILGRDKFGRPNFVKFDYDGGGSIYIHLAPMAFTNFFLLHKNNKTYYDNALSYLPKNSTIVRWDDYFRYHTAGSDNKDGNGLFGAGSWLFKQKGLSTALLLLLALMLIIYLFESKRKQRVIPVILPLKNASVDFVKTVGRLYFQRHDNKNLALKMTVHFQDHVRSRYGIRSSLNDPEFEKKLAWKTGYNINNLKNMLFFMNSLQKMHDVTDDALLEFNRKLDHFYKYA
ncbi:hypothetical protein A4H97_14790 [Niastella yeongjuensis]|uniref:DUF4350 domain-containing protein n=2 Tax=Niastella yeongjuensis TaxID=354355 RepID=A0A1V9E416_9BACT|nr:hypothetical protein A4H97_14790 [Niastella yeongjuensis]SEO99258.1 hypothetical protein SAMN05660816_04093 [Niastella yeongjuensis]